MKDFLWKHWHSIAAAVALVVLTLFCFPIRQASKPLVPHPVIHNAQEAWQAAQPHLNTAETETNQSVERHLSDRSAVCRSLAVGSHRCHPGRAADHRS